MTTRFSDHRLFGCLAAVMMLFGQSFAANAGQIATFELTPKPGNNGLTIFQADVNPAFSVVPVNPNASPLTILDGSSGFNPDNLTVLLGNGDGVQQLVMLFGVQPSYDDAGKISGFQPILDSGGNPDPGLSSSGVLKFSLDLAPDFSGTLSLLPTPTSAQAFDLTTLSIPTPSSNTTPNSSSTVPTTQVPEPVSMALWIIGMGFGTLRALRYRNNRQAVA